MRSTHTSGRVGEVVEGDGPGVDSGAGAGRTQRVVGGAFFAGRQRVDAVDDAGVRQIDGVGGGCRGGAAQHEDRTRHECEHRCPERAHPSPFRGRRTGLDSTLLRGCDRSLWAPCESIPLAAKS